MIATSSRLAVGTPKRASSTASAGCVTDEQFQSAFSDTVPLNISSTKELIAECHNQTTILENVNNDWNKRVKALQMLRSILISGGMESQEFVSQCYTLIGTALQLSIKDLRSQVCREACITVALYCEKMGTHFWRIAELLVPTLMQLSQNSAKVMSTSSRVALHYVAKYVRNSKLATLLMSFKTSKAKEVRRAAASLIVDIITNWESSILEKCWPEVIGGLKASLYDADVETRAFGRQAYEALQALYPQRAEFLFQSLDTAKQRMLSGRSSTASSTHSINSERENLQAPSRGLYAAAQQSAFLSKRSTSDLNHSIRAIRKMNLGASQRVVHRPNPVRSAKPPQANPIVPKANVPPETPVQRKTPLPNVMPRITQSATASIEKSSKSTSQPGSRSSSPNKFRAPRIPGHVNDRKPANGTSHSSAFSTTRNPPNTAANKAELAKALKNVDMHSRGARQNHIGNFDDYEYALSPTTGFVNRNPPTRFSNSPNGSDPDFYEKPRISNGKNAANLFQSGSEKWLYKKGLLLNDPREQFLYVEEICNVLQNNTSKNCNEKEVETALSAFSHAVRDGVLNSWDDYFTMIFLALIQAIQHENDAIKLGALRALKDLCICQPKRMEEKPEMVMMKVLNAHNSSDATVVRVAEDCCCVLASYFSVDVCLDVLLAVIDDPQTAYHQLVGAIKMLSRVLEKLSVAEVQDLLPTIVGRMMKCYENSQSMVRRASIICLVAISNAIGIEMLKPHLNPSTLKLVEVYRDRMARPK